MKNLASLISRFKSSLDKDSLTKELIAMEIKKETGVDLDKNKLSINRDGVLEIEASSATKMAIKLKEDYIRNTLKAKGVGVTRILYK